MRASACAVVDSGTWTAQTNYTTAVVEQVPKFLNLDNYPDMQGNLVFCADPGNGGSAAGWANTTPMPPIPVNIPQMTDMTDHRFINSFLMHLAAPV